MNSYALNYNKNQQNQIDEIDNNILKEIIINIWQLVLL